jgi:hypothetical protein
VEGFIAFGIKVVQEHDSARNSYSFSSQKGLPLRKSVKKSAKTLLPL